MANRSKKSHSSSNSGGRSSSSSSSASPPPRLFCIRFTLVLLIIALTGASLFFGNSLNNLYGQVQSDSATIDSLQSQIAKQQAIIARFNTSVTNADIQTYVQQLGDELHQTEADMKLSLQQAHDNIELMLTTTVANLNQTVKTAEATIQQDVNTVKQDVQQYVLTTQDQFSMENHFMTFQLAGTFCLLAILISMWHMTAHIREFKRPFVQRKILAILWMSPIYAVTSWLSLVFPKFEGYLAIIKDFYEAYVIYQFLGFCISVLGKGGNREEVVDLLTKHADHLDPPMRFCGWCRGKYPYDTPRQLASAVLLQCQVFAMQFVFLKPLTAVGLFSCEKFDFCNIPDDQHIVIYGIPVHALESPVLWLRVVQNISVFVAFSGLLKFYHAVQDDLAWCNPFPKFLCIKGIVFMTFWQGLVISFLASTTEIGQPKHGSGHSDGGSEDATDLWGKQAQNFLICLEMLLFSIAHFYCFPIDEWQEGYQPIMEKKVKGISDNMAFGDFVADLKLILRGSDTKKKKAKVLEKKIDNKLLKDDGGDEKNVFGGNDDTIKASANGSDIEEGNSKNTDNETKPKGNVNADNSDITCGDKLDAVHSDINESMFSQDGMDLDDEAMDALLTESIRESLSDKNIEVREAAQRLLRNRMVDNDHNISEGNRSGSESSKSSTADYGALVAASDDFHSEYTSLPPMGGDIATSETTSLLVKSGDESDESMGAMNNFG